MDFLLTGLAQHGYAILFAAVFLDHRLPVPAAIALLIAVGASGYIGYLPGLGSRPAHSRHPPRQSIRCGSRDVGPRRSDLRRPQSRLLRSETPAHPGLKTLRAARAYQQPLPAPAAASPCTSIAPAFAKPPAPAYQRAHRQGVNVSVIQGGLRAWKKAGLPLESVPSDEVEALPAFEP